MARGLERVEIWTDIECFGGTKVCVVPDVISVIEEFEVGLSEVATIELPRLSPAWAEVEHRRVVRVVLTDDSYTEWRIAPSLQDQLDQDGALRATLRCESIKYDLGASIIERVEADGRAHGVFTLLGMTPEEQTDFILPYAKTYFEKGTLEVSAEQDLQYDNDSPLSALMELAHLSDSELEVVRNGTTSYRVHLREEIGSAAAKAYLRVGKNISQVRRRSKADAMANRVFPVGATQGGVQATMGNAEWQVSSVAGSVVSLTGAVMVFDGQLDGTYLRKPDGSLTQVSASTAPGDVTVGDASGLAPGNMVGFRRDASGGQLTYLEDTASIATYGQVERVVRRADIPLIENLLPNPLLNQYSAGVPQNWSAVGGAVISENTDDLYTRFGGSSAHVVADQDEGITSNALAITPTGTSPHFSAQISVRIVSGTILFRLKDATNGTYYPGEDSEEKTRRNVSDRWIDRLAIEGIDLNVVGCGSAQLEIIAVGGPAEFYIDAGQLEQQATSSSTFLGGRASNLLWEAGNAWLEVNSQPLVEFDVDVADLERLHPDLFQYDELVLGGTVQVVVPDLDLDFSTRIKKIVRDVAVPGVSRVELSNSLDDLVGKLGTPGRRPREDLGKDTGTSDTPTFKHARAYINADGDLVFSYRLNLPHGLSVALAHDLLAQPTRKEVLDADHANYLVQDSAEEDELIVAAGVAANPDDEVFLTAVAYSGANATGFPGEMFDVHLRVSISGTQIDDGTIIADKLTDQAKTFNTDMAFTPYASDRVSWTAGTLVLADDSTFSINSGDSGVLSGLTFIYFDRTVSETELNVTTDYTVAVGENVVLLAVCKDESSGNGRAFLVTGVGILGINQDVLGVNSVGTTTIRDDAITTPKLVANAVSADKILAGAVTTVKLAAAAVETDKLAANSVTAAKINVVSLSAISADLGTVTAGYIRNASNTAAIRMSGTTTLPSNNYLDFTATGSSPFMRHDSLTLHADGNATFSGDLAAGIVTASAIDAGAVTADKLASNSVTAAKINVSSLSAIAADLGTVTAGTISAGIIIASGTFTAASPVFSGEVAFKTGLGFVTSKIGGSGFGCYQYWGVDDGTLNRGNVRVEPEDGGAALFAYGGDGSTKGARVITMGDGKLAFFSTTTPTTKPTITGSRGGNAALASALTAIANLGLATDATSA